MGQDSSCAPCSVFALEFFPDGSPDEFGTVQIKPLHAMIHGLDNGGMHEDQNSLA